MASTLAALLVLTSGYVTVHPTSTAVMPDGQSFALAWRVCERDHADLYFSPLVLASPDDPLALQAQVWEYAGAYDCMTGYVAGQHCDVDAFFASTSEQERTLARGWPAYALRNECFAASVVVDGLHADTVRP